MASDLSEADNVPDNSSVKIKLYTYSLTSLNHFTAICKPLNDFRFLGGRVKMILPR